MGKTLQTQIDVAASKEKVWSILADFPAYPQWNPFIKNISGELRAGAKLNVHIQPPLQRGITLHPRVLSAVPDQELRWLGHLLIPGVFDGEHHFLIQEMAGRQGELCPGGDLQGSVDPIHKQATARHKAGLRADESGTKEEG